MLVEILSLVIVLLFVTLLHCYAKWFLAQNVRSSSVLVQLPPPRGFYNLHNLLTMDRTNEANDVSTSIKGLDSSVISSIPQFVYSLDEENGLGRGLECATCLSLFENEEKGRKLVFCGHAFHVECIDMWLHSHTTCPVCRAPAAGENDVMLDASSELNNETNMNVGEFFETSSSLSEVMRLSNEDASSRLEIVVEVPNTHNGSK